MAQSNLTEKTIWYQTILKVAGEQPSLVVDGDFGPSTREALKCFQMISELEPKGVLDVPTNVALNKVAMEWTYRELIPGAPGKMTEELRNTLKRFQQHYGLEADGEVGPATRDVMVRVLRTELPSPLRYYHAHLGQGWPPGTPEPTNLGLEGATAVKGNIIFGKGKRDLTENTLFKPYRWVCLLNPEYEAAAISFGSGLLISPRHVLSAAHVIDDYVDDDKGKRRKMQVARVFVSPGHDGRPAAQRSDGTAGAQPFGNKMGSKFQMPKDFDPYVERDYALIELEKPIGDTTFELSIRTTVAGKRKTVKEKVRLGYWGDSPGYEIRAVEAKDFNGVDLFSAGYPKYLWKRQAVATGPGVENALSKTKRTKIDGFSNVIFSHIDIDYGQSGSPVWRHVKKNGEVVSQLVGVMIGGDRNFNYTVALTEGVLRQIASWAPKTFKYSEEEKLLSVKK